MFLLYTTAILVSAVTNSPLFYVICMPLLKVFTVLTRSLCGWPLCIYISRDANLDFLYSSVVRFTAPTYLLENCKTLIIFLKDNMQIISWNPLGKSNNITTIWSRVESQDKLWYFVYSFMVVQCVIHLIILQ